MHYPATWEAIDKLSDEDIYELYEELYDERSSQLAEPTSLSAAARREVVESEARLVIASKSPMGSPSLGASPEGKDVPVHVPWYQIMAKDELMQIEKLSDEDILDLYTELYNEKGAAAGEASPSQLDASARRSRVQEEAARQLQST